MWAIVLKDASANTQTADLLESAPSVSIPLESQVLSASLRQRVVLSNTILLIVLVLGSLIFPPSLYPWLPLWILVGCLFLLWVNTHWASQLYQQLNGLFQSLQQLQQGHALPVAPQTHPYTEFQQLQQILTHFPLVIHNPPPIKVATVTPMVQVALEKNELESVLHCMNDGLIIYDMDLNVILLNPALAQMLIPSNPAATGRLIQNPDDKLLFERCVEPPKMKEIHKAMVENPIFPRSDVIELKSPMQFLKRYASPLFNIAHGQIGHVIIYHDITQEVKNERIRSEFITNASHELRTPVTSIKLLLESLLAGAKDDPEVRDEFLNNLMREVNRLHILVNDLLDLARLESSHEKLAISEFDLRKVIRETIQTVQPLAQQKGIVIKENIQSELNLIRADQLRLGQVLVNLVNNAVKFTSNSGEVRVIVRKFNDNIEFSVQDTGIGIPTDDLPYIFDRFYRVDSNRQRGQNKGGSGLGLTISKQVVDMHGGKMKVDSIPNKGTTFTFTIPQKPIDA